MLHTERIVESVVGVRLVVRSRARHVIESLAVEQDVVSSGHGWARLHLRLVLILTDQFLLQVKV